MRCCRGSALARALGTAAVSLVLITACGGGDDSSAPAAPPAPPLALILGYGMPQSPSYPAGSIIISPPNGRRSISDDGPVRVDLELAGFPAQRLDAPNFQPKDTAQLKYVFALPQALAVEPPTPCVAVAAKVTVTSVTGAIGVANFQVCAGVGLGLEA